jgi:glutamate N-acetyltransferase/amino-acid N-acetyltransferase
MNEADPMVFDVPGGFRVAGVHCGIKQQTDREDVTLIVADRPAVAAGLYTQNQVVAASVKLSRNRTPSSTIRAVIVTSGNANACTGRRGDQDALQIAHWTADRCGVDTDQVLVLATGVIGQPLPMDQVDAGVRGVIERLGTDHDALLSAARGMLTTDSVTKIHGCRIDAEGTAIELTGIAKGAAMIGPHMATMLAVVLTDAVLTPATAQQALAQAVNPSFNSISVDGHMSTNDSVLLLASGTAGGQPLTGPRQTAFQQGLDEVCRELARAIVADGEGASHRIEVEVSGCSSHAAAAQIARTVANSPLVKAAIAGADPNWGRIVSAAGYAGVPLDADRVCLELNGFLLCENGGPVDFDTAAVSRSIRANRDVHVALRLAEGDHAARFWTTDLTAEYVRLNSETTT